MITNYINIKMTINIFFLKGSSMISITQEAMNKINIIRSDKGKGFLRISVDGGGCSGFSYSFQFENTKIIKQKNDIIAIKDIDGNPALVTDQASMNYLTGSKVHWKEDLSGAAFVINNPNATSSCGCGTSFSVI